MVFRYVNDPKGDGTNEAAYVCDCGYELPRDPERGLVFPDETCPDCGAHRDGLEVGAETQ